MNPRVSDVVQSAQPQLPILVTSMYVNKEGYSKKLSSGAKDQKQNGNQITVYLKLSKCLKLLPSYNAEFLFTKMEFTNFPQAGRHKWGLLLSPAKS